MVGFFRPENLQDALVWLDTRSGRIAAGCTDLFAATERQELAGEVMDITGVAELRGVSVSESGWRIGASTTWSEVIDAPLPPAFDGLKAAAAEVGSGQIQNAATVAGNLCNASPAADGVPPLLTLDATVEILSLKGGRIISLTEFITGPRQTALLPNEIIAAIHIPKTAGTGQSAFLKLGARMYLVISIAMVAVRVSVLDGIIRDPAVAVGACSPVAKRLPDLERRLSGCPIAVALDRVTREIIAPELSPIDDIRADRDYRITAAMEATRRTIAAALKRSAETVA